MINIKFTNNIKFVDKQCILHESIAGDQFLPIISREIGSSWFARKILLKYMNNNKVSLKLLVILMVVLIRDVINYDGIRP